MIIQIKGVLRFKGEKFIVLESGGIGYKIFVSLETLSRLPQISKEVVLWTHLYVRENALDLYGFLEYAELEFFEKLIQIPGVGPKTALSVLTLAPLNVLKKAIASGEASYLTKVSGIGHRLAEKIVVDLKDKYAGGLSESSGNNDFFDGAEEAIEALRSLGYSLRESREAVRKVSSEAKTVEEIIKEALRNINKR